MVVYYGKVNDSVWISWRDLFVNTTYKANPARHESGGEVWVPSLAILPVMQVDASYPIIGKLRFQIFKIAQEHRTCFFIVVDEKYPLVL